jgi:thiol-disulfide isomerase/thioredoxin
MIQKLAPCLVAAVLISAVIAGCSAPSQPTSETSASATVTDFTSDTLNEYLGEVVILNFWATWCMPCVVEMPALEAIYQEYHDDGVVVLGVNVTDSSADILAFAREHGLTFPVLRDPGQQAMRANDIRVLPTTFFIDRQGQIQQHKLGSMSESFLQEQVEFLLN